MTEGTSVESKIAVLAKRIDDQARFTRAVTVICTTAILGVMFYMLTEIFSTLPGLIISSVIGQMDTLNSVWRATDAAASRRFSAPAASTQPSTVAPATPSSKKKQPSAM